LNNENKNDTALSECTVQKITSSAMQNQNAQKSAKNEPMQMHRHNDARIQLAEATIQKRIKN